MRGFFVWFNMVLALGAIAAILWVVSLPNRSECLASGRTVDPTERHCVAADGYHQLEEHAWFHSREVILGTTIVWIAAYLIHRRSRRRSRTLSTT